MRLCIITGSYPSPSFPAAGAFVRQFALALARVGSQVIVVNPVSVPARRLGPLPVDHVESVGSGCHVQGLTAAVCLFLDEANRRNEHRAANSTDI